MSTLCRLRERHARRARALAVVAFTLAAGSALLRPAVAQKTCGTLDLQSPLTAQCFPDDGTHHHVCCVDIDIPTDKSDLTALERHKFSQVLYYRDCFEIIVLV
jgi:hypothetical protein